MPTPRSRAQRLPLDRPGPALGGTRFHPSTSDAAAAPGRAEAVPRDVLQAAVACLDLGGGKAVTVGGPQCPKTPEPLRHPAAVTRQGD